MPKPAAAAAAAAAATTTQNSMAPHVKAVAILDLVILTRPETDQLLVKE